MCYSCYQEYGSPRLVSPDIIKAAGLCDKVNDSGHLHIIVGDFNIRDSDIDSCEKKVKKNKFRYDRSHAAQSLADEQELLDLLRKMTIKERASAIGLADGYFEVCDGVTIYK